MEGGEECEGVWKCLRARFVYGGRHWRRQRVCAMIAGAPEREPRGAERANGKGLFTRSNAEAQDMPGRSSALAACSEPWGRKAITLGHRVAILTSVAILPVGLEPTTYGS